MTESTEIRTNAHGRSAAIAAALFMLLACATAARAEGPLLAPPSNDDCVGAIAIPPSSLPHFTDPVNLLEATAVGEPALCSTSSKTVWYTFTPTETGTYEFTTCPGVALATNLYSAVLSVLTATSCAETFTGVQNGCSYRDALCGEEFWQPRVTVSLTAGSVYYIVAGAIASPVGGKETLQIRVSRAVAPSNDKCAAATPVTLGVPEPGTWALATNDYTLPIGTNCYSLPSGPPPPVGQVDSRANGRDVVYSFTPDTTGTYSFKVQLATDGQNVVSYVATECESGASPEPVDSCIGAANRNGSIGIWSGTEEIVCVPLLAGQTYYAFADENGSAGNTPQHFLEVTRCSREAEPNDTPALATGATSGVEAATGTANDFDYVSLGAPPAGTRAFAMADQVAANTTAIQMRVTDAISTLEFDDSDNAFPWGFSSPNIAGRALEGTHAYIQISPNSATTISEPYRLTYVLQPPGAGYGGSSASPNSGSNSPPNYNVAGNLFFSGEIFPEGDVDPFTLCAHAGDEIFVSLDNDPIRDDTPFDGSLTIWNTHAVGIGFFDTNSSSDSTSGSGSLTATTPNSPADALTWRARATGRHRINVYSTATGPAATGDYLLSIAVNGQIGAEQSVDLEITMTDSPDPVSTGSLLDYTVTVTNAGPNIALMATMTDTLPTGTTFASLEGSGSGGTWTCTVPATGTNGTVSCANPCFEDGGSYTFTIRVRLDHCLGDGTVLTNTASIVNLTADSDGGNNASSTITTVADNGDCDDGSLCTTVDACNGTVCEGSLPLDCDDLENCTVDSCDAILGCQNVAIPLPAEVDESLRMAKTGTDAEVSWSDPPGPFNVYRGNRPGAAPWSYNQGCVAPLTEGPYTDVSVPAVLEYFYYLVSRENACGQESTVGHDDQGTPDPNPNPCP